MSLLLLLSTAMQDATPVSNTTELAAAIASNAKAIVIPKNTTLNITGLTSNGSDFGAYVLNEGQIIIGEDRWTSIINVTGNGRALQLGNNSGAYNITFIGQGKAGANNWQAGIVTYGVGWEIAGCRFVGLSGDSTANGGGGVFGIPFTDVGADYDFKDGSRITGCDFISNNTGLNIANRVEFLSVSDCRFLRNNTGLVNRAGNNGFSDSNFMDNIIGFSLQTGTNDGHGSITNCRINHNGTPFKSTSQANGFKVVGCMLYYGNIEITDSTNIVFVGCDLVGVGATFTNTASNTKLVGCTYDAGGYTFSGTALTII